MTATGAVLLALVFVAGVLIGGFARLERVLKQLNRDANDQLDRLHTEVRDLREKVTNVAVDVGAIQRRVAPDWNDDEGEQA
jgi:outer membrane murein-binding lipoprotein Lpp